VNAFNNVILARNRQLPDDDRMIETCRSIFKKKVLKVFNIKLNRYDNVEAIQLLDNSALLRRLNRIRPFELAN
jgi:hypothetical protein